MEKVTCVDLSAFALIQPETLISEEYIDLQRNSCRMVLTYPTKQGKAESSTASGTLIKGSK